MVLMQGQKSSCLHALATAVTTTLAEHGDGRMHNVKTLNSMTIILHTRAEGLGTGNKELLDAILDPLAPHLPTLASVARTCAAINPSATRLLYRHLSVSAYARNLSVVNTLAIRPDLARFVRTFSITLDDTDPVFRAFYVDLQRALASMMHLTDLTLLIDASASWVLSNGGQLQGTLYPFLEQFVCAFPLDASVLGFIARTPGLRSLQLPVLPSIVDSLLPTHIPRLVSYTGPASLLPILASRPLTTLHLLDDLSLDNIPPPVVSTRTSETISFSGHTVHPDGEMDTQAHVQVLSAVTSAPPAQVLEALALAYPGLVCLRLMTTAAFWEAPDMTFYTRIASTLSTLPSLAVFELSGMHWASRPKSPSSSFSPSVEKEWLSPPITPRAVELAEPDELDGNRDYDFDGAFLDWSY
ncbi:hypothetical protein A0H81_03535 [Grifola frondosa]|uniref:F-box domain-containing protein n=1 Tax=Grifola frondosa TaxID=5627 RepID=A0A1C7MJC5_GRIFR|nr:hypothetical protein A0H81_03535 [Grifola frondosa]